MQSVIVSTFAPFPTVSMQLPSSTPLSALSYILSPLCPPHQQSLSLVNNTRISTTSTQPLSSLRDHVSASSPLFVRLSVKLPGGKGGFASQLRAQGGRMSSNKASNNDSCRDLNGRRLSTIKEAQKLAEYIQSAPVREQAQKAQAQARLDALNAEIQKLSGESNQKRRLDDNEYIEQSKEIVEGVKDAVKLAMLKKRKKNNTEKENKNLNPASKPAPVAAAATEASAEAGPSSASASSQDESKDNAKVVGEAPVEDDAKVMEDEVDDPKAASTKKGKGRATRAAKK
ncbi:hypothetical protein ACM66B_006666 [Microbotryomycetes sp. NB124-2]